jgi:hypothetical protein
MTKKAKKVPFDPKVFLATANGGRTLSKYRTDKAIFSQGDPADAVFYIQRVRSRSLSFPSKGRKPSLRYRVPTNSWERMPDGTAAAHGYSHRNDRMRDHAVGKGSHHPRSP